MDLKALNIEKFNIIQDEENYYFFRALNMADNSDVEQGITLSKNGKIQRIRTDRERFKGEAKYSADSQMSLEEVYDHIKENYRKDTNCISLTTDSNVAIRYGRYLYKDKYVMVKIPKIEFGEKVVSASQYMLMEICSKIEQAVANLTGDKKIRILEILKKIENARCNKTLEDMITVKYTLKTDALNSKNAYLKKGITYNAPVSKICSNHVLDEKQLLEVNKVYAELVILEREHIIKHIISGISNTKLIKTVGRAISSAELIHYGEIKKESIIEIPTEVVDIFALIQKENNNPK